MQQLSFNVTVPIPEDSVLISKAQLIELQKNELHGVYWNMKDLEARTGRKREWIEQNILFRPQFRKELGEFVYYPTRGQKWSFQASKMADFLDKNFHRIFKERAS